MLPKKFDPDYCWRAFLRRKWLIIIPFLLISIACFLYAITRPKVYRASASIRVKRQDLASGYIRSRGAIDLKENIATTRQQITSRTKLIMLITKYGLYASGDPSKPDMELEDKLATARSNIEFYIPRRGHVFRISFTDGDPQKAKDVANALSADFVVEYLRSRKEQLGTSTQLLQGELERIETRLRTKEAAVTAYKSRHMGGLPDQLSANLAMLSQLQHRIENIDRSLDEAHAQKHMLEDQLTETVNSPDSELRVRSTTLEADDEMSLNPDLQELQKRLASMRLRYTENHPDVIRMRTMIASIEKAQQTTAEKDKSVTGNRNSPEGNEVFKSKLESLKLRLSSTVSKIRDLRTEKAKLEQQSIRLTKSIENTPTRRLELMSLEREYGALRNQYSSLISKKLESELVDSVEEKQHVDEAKVVNWATKPQEPVTVDLIKIIFMGLCAGLAAGLGLAFGVEYLDQTFREYRELGDFLQLPVLAVIPKIKTTAEAIRRRRLKVGLCLTGLLFIAVSIGVWLWLDGNLQELIQKIRI